MFLINSLLALHGGVFRSADATASGFYQEYFPSQRLRSFADRDTWCHFFLLSLALSMSLCVCEQRFSRLSLINAAPAPSEIKRRVLALLEPGY